MAQGTRGLVASACLLPNLVMTAAEWAGDQVQGPGASRECFDARDPIPQRECKPLRKPPDATWWRGPSALQLLWRGRCWKGQVKPLGHEPGVLDRRIEQDAWRTNRARRSKLARCLLQVARCKVQGATPHVHGGWGGGESRMPYFYDQDASSSQSTGRARGGARGDRRPGLPGLGAAEQSIVERTGWRLEG